MSSPLASILIASLLLIGGTGASASDWDRFRGPNGAGQSDGAGIPTEWKPENFLWRKSLPGVGHSSPIISNKRLYITSGDEKTGQQIIQAYDSLNGKLLWERRADAGTYDINNLNSFASSTPAADARHVYILWLANGRVFLTAWTHDGQQAWQRDVGSFSEEHGFGKSPVVVDDIVYVANDSEATSAIMALDATSGEPRWQIPRASGTTPFATPCLLDPLARRKQLLTLSTAEGLSAIDLASGQVAWQGLKKDLPLRCVASPIVAHGLVFVECGQGGSGKVLIAARPGDENNGPQEVYRIDKNVPNVPTPVAANDLLFLWQDRGVVSCHDVATGKQHWRNRVGGDFHSSPIRIGDRILAASRNGEVVILAADIDFQLLARNDLKEPCHATPAVADNRLYIRTESTLFCIGTPADAARD